MNRKFGGSGLGLSISKRIAEMMNGKMWFDSIINTGTTFFFTITVPYSLDLNVLAKMRRGSAHIIVSNHVTDNVDTNIRILIAEDNPLNQQIIQKLLKSIG